MTNFAQLNITMANHGASVGQFREMCSLIGKLANTSTKRPVYVITQYVVVLMNQACGREEAIYKMKTFLRG